MYKEDIESNVMKRNEMLKLMVLWCDFSLGKSSDTDEMEPWNLCNDL
jgi:hypothetical protein